MACVTQIVDINTLATVISKKIATHSMVCFLCESQLALHLVKQIQTNTFCDKTNTPMCRFN